MRELETAAGREAFGHLGHAWGLIRAARRGGLGDEFGLAALIDAEVELESLSGLRLVEPPPSTFAGGAASADLIAAALGHVEAAGEVVPVGLVGFLREALRWAVGA